MATTATCISLYEELITVLDISYQYSTVHGVFCRVFKEERRKGVRMFKFHRQHLGTPAVVWIQSNAVPGLVTSGVLSFPLGFDWVHPPKSLEVNCNPPLRVSLWARQRELRAEQRPPSVDTRAAFSSSDLVESQETCPSHGFPCFLKAFPLFFTAAQTSVNPETLKKCLVDTEEKFCFE